MPAEPPARAARAATDTRERCRSVDLRRPRAQLLQFAHSPGTCLGRGPPRRLRPNARPIEIWDHVLLLCVLQESFLLPYFLAFQPEAVGAVSTFFVISVACEGVFAVDLYVQAHTGYYCDGNLIRDKKLTIRRYVRSFQFLLDVVAILPYQVFVIRYPRVVAKLLFLKLLRWSRLLASLDEFYTKHLVVLKILKVVASAVYLAHVLACVRYSFGCDDTNTNHWLPQSVHHHRSLHKEYGSSTSNRAGPKKADVAPSAQQTNIQDQMKKVNEISAGSYFGENGLFTNAQRNAFIQAQTSCILYSLSPESLETVFDRYPEWKQKVLRIASIHREQARLVQLSREEQRRRTTTASSMILSRADIMNERAERLKEKMYSSRLQRSNSVHFNLIRSSSKRGYRWVGQTVLKPSLKVLDCIVHGVAVQSNFHILGLRFMVCCTMYVAVMVPYQLSMDSMDRPTIPASIVKAVGLQCEIAFIVDIWFSWHIQESPAAMELYDQKLRSVYKNERLVFDVIAAIFFYGFLSAFKCSSWIKLLRCVKIFNVMSYLNELKRRSVTSKITRFWHVWILYLLIIYWAACAYLAVAMQAGFGSEWEGWLPSQGGCFRKNHIVVELYLTRLHVSDRLKLRTYAFMTSLWSSHAGVSYEELLTEMPHSIRTACVLQTSKEPVDWFVMKVVRPVCWEGEEGVEAFTLSLASSATRETKTS